MTIYSRVRMVEVVVIVVVVVVRWVLVVVRVGGRSPDLRVSAPGHQDRGQRWETDIHYY